MSASKKFILVDDELVTQKDFALYLVDTTNMKQPKRIPGFIIKLVLGNDLYEIVKMNCKVSNAKEKNI